MTTPTTPLSQVIASTDQEATDASHRITYCAEAVAWANTQLPDTWTEFALQLSETAGEAIRCHTASGRNARLRNQAARAQLQADRPPS